MHILVHAFLVSSQGMLLLNVCGPHFEWEGAIRLPHPSRSPPPLSFHAQIVPISLQASTFTMDEKSCFIQYICFSVLFKSDHIF